MSKQTNKPQDKAQKPQSNPNQSKDTKPAHKPASSNPADKKNKQHAK